MKATIVGIIGMGSISLFSFKKLRPIGEAPMVLLGMMQKTLLRLGSGRF